MSNQLYSGQGRDINVFAGQSLAVSSITGAYTATIIAGAGIGTALATDSTGGATYGPYSGGVTVRLQAGEGGLIDYEAAVSPVLNYAGPARLGYSAAGDTSSVVDGAGNTYSMLPPVKLLRVAVVGDSTADTGSLKIGASKTLSNTTDQETVTAALADAPVSGFKISMSQLALYQFYPAARLVANCGISGQTTTQVLDRETATESTTRRAMSDMLSTSPDVAILRIGINDIFAFTPATSQATIDAVHTKRMDIIYRLVSMGVRVLVEGIYGYDATSGTPPTAANLAAVRAVILYLNRRAAEDCANIGIDWCRVLETSGVTHDGTGAFLPGFSGSNDGTHLSFYGQRVLGAAEAAILRQWFGPSVQNVYRGANLLNVPGTVNSRATFPDSLATAGVPYGFSSAIIGPANGVAISNAAIVNRNNRRWWTIDTSAATGTAPVVSMQLGGFNSAATYPVAFIAGQTYGVEFEWFIETQDGSPMPANTSFLGKLVFTNGTDTLTYFNIASRTSTVTTSGSASRWAGKMVFNPITLSDGSGTLTASSLLAFQTLVTFPGTALRIGIAGVNIVKL